MFILNFHIFRTKVLKNQACSFLTLVNSSTSVEYDSYVDGRSSNDTYFIAIGHRCNLSRVVKCTSMFCTVITSLPVQNHKNMDNNLPFSDLTNHFKCSKDVDSASFAGSALTLSCFEDIEYLKGLKFSLEHNTMRIRLVENVKKLYHASLLTHS